MQLAAYKWHGARVFSFYSCCKITTHASGGNSQVLVYLQASCIVMQDGLCTLPGKNPDSPRFHKKSNNMGNRQSGINLKLSFDNTDSEGDSPRQRRTSAPPAGQYIE
jgi:hypothetical protein